MKQYVLALSLFTGMVMACSGCASSPGTPPATTPLAAARCQQLNGRADARCNPGLASANPELLADGPAYRHTLCAPSDGNPDTLTWVQKQRPRTAYTNALKTSQMQAYGLAGNPRDYEEDHIIPLSIGGHPTDPRNLYPELWAGAQGAKVKDREEKQLWIDVCARRLTLTQAQTKIVHDWTH